MSPRVFNSLNRTAVTAQIMRDHGIENCYMVMRGTEWGNPFILTQECDRDKVCDLFEAYAAWRLTIQPTWLDALRGKHLLCHCAPKRCHADTLLRLANRDVVAETPQ